MIDHMLHHFRRASRELFNQYFYCLDPVLNQHAAACFAPVEARLFAAMAEQANWLDVVAYGIRQPNIAVRLDFHQDIDIRLCHNHDRHDWQVHCVPRHENIRFSFVRFTDLHDSYERDYRYAMVQIEYWPAHPEHIGALALINHECAVYYHDHAISVLDHEPSDATHDPLDLF
jgi:hypothetical protein